MERGLLNYYSIAANYSQFSARIHYILKYSCILTLASKLRLGTKAKVIKRFGIGLKIPGPNEGDIVAEYPTPSYKRPKARKEWKDFDPTESIDTLVIRKWRSQKITTPFCSLCGKEGPVEMHHLRTLRKQKTSTKTDWLRGLMSRINRKQLPVCKGCHQKIHKGEYSDGTKLGEIADLVMADMRWRSK